jgi:predicted RNA-binding protein with PUA-like domain
LGGCQEFRRQESSQIIVGVCKVIKEYFPDPTAKEGDWSAVEIAPVKALNKPVSLGVIKAVPELKNMPLVRIGRLSVMPLEKTEFDRIIELSETTI